MQSFFVPRSALQCSSLHRSRYFLLCAVQTRSRRLVVVPRSAQTDEAKGESVAKLKKQLEESGLTKEIASQALDDWRKEIGHEVTADDLRKVLTKTSGQFTGLLVLQLLLDAGLAYSALLLGDLLGVDAVVQSASGSSSIPIWVYGVLQAIGYILAGYYATGVFFDIFKLTAMAYALYQFNINPATFLEAVKSIAANNNAGLGLASLDKAKEAVSTVKVLGALNAMADRLQKEQKERSGPALLKDLGAYLTLEKAQRSFNFDAGKLGLTDAQAADIALVFSDFDKDDDGVLSLEEFKKLCAKYAPELSEAEVQAGFGLLDTNKDRQVEFKEFADWWMKKLKLP